MVFDPAADNVMMTISRLARQFGLSRSTLLYYDRIGLLRPSGRSPSNYRLYTDADRRRLEAVCRYRQLGLSLKAIERILGASREGAGSALEQRLRDIENQIKALRSQQRIIRRLLDRASREDMAEGLTREKWTTLLRAAGMTDAEMLQWHVEFERLFPDDHQVFLESLGITPQDIDTIRAFSKTGKS
jgi:DNA-binding transcriptional MerR regulator